MSNSRDDIQAALAYVPAHDRDLWLRVGMAVKSQLGEDGFDVWDAWSQQDDSYQTADARAVWRSIKPTGKVGIGTLFYEAQRYGYKRINGNGSSRPDPSEIARREREMREAEAREIQEHKDAAALAVQILESSVLIASSDNPYLKRKGICGVETLGELPIAALKGAIGYHPKSKGEPLTGRVLIAPVLIDGTVSSLEFIDEAGRKSALAGGAKTAGYWATGELPDGDGSNVALQIAEGVATALSLWQATGSLTLAALSCGNLERVARAMRERYPAAHIVVCADLGKGQSDAERAAHEARAFLAVPAFGADRAEGDKDFNDLHRARGAEAVRQAIANARSPDIANPFAQASSATATTPLENTAPANTATNGANHGGAAADVIAEPAHETTGPAIDGLLRNKDGDIRPCEHNARLLIAHEAKYAALYFDAFLARPRFGDRDWIDADELEVLCWLQSAHCVPGFKLPQARNGIAAVAYARRRDSLREFVEGLPPWDGTARIETAFCDAWGAPDTALMRASSRNFFVAMVARAIQPGAQVDTIWCFEGPQGTYKSQALRALGGEFHAEVSAPAGTTDFMRELRGLWLAELSELDSLRGREATTVKRLLSAPADRFVQKYALHAESYPRRAITVATTNEAAYWQDATGARRLIPAPCGEIRVDLIKGNRLQWFAEALAAYRASATWWEFPDAISDAQDERQQVDPWEDELRAFMKHGRRSGEDGQGIVPWPEGWIASAEIMRDWLDLKPSQQGQRSSTRLGHVMRRLGYAPKRSASGNERGWIPVADTQSSENTEGVQ